MRERKCCSSRSRGLDWRGETAVDGSEEWIMELTEQRAINSKVSADGIWDVGAMAGIARREAGRGGERTFQWFVNFEALRFCRDSGARGFTSLVTSKEWRMTVQAGLDQPSNPSSKSH
jgi:hypothetical protein